MDPKPTLKELGAEIRRRRRAFGWRIDDLEERSGVNYLTIQQFETGKRAITAWALVCIADALDCDLGLIRRI